MVFIVTMATNHCSATIAVNAMAVRPYMCAVASIAVIN